VAKIETLNARELKKLISDAEKQLHERARLESVAQQVEKIFAKNKLKRAEISQVLKLLAEGGSKKPNTAAKRAPATRGKIAAKYKNPASNETWTGRGRSPKWVTAILAQESMSIEQFKASDRYKI
jgi:DNA-binding protein H-NS